jgi:ABC-2 type transport system ATP-binding protein
MKQRFGVAVALLGNPKLMIVDEPTAGLDPAERVRFLNLLSELGENSVVILSTHIVDDVSELCTRMAIIDKGRILQEGEPLKAMASLEGKIWRCVVGKSTLQTLAQEHKVISTRLFGGRTLVHIYCESKPAPGFDPVAPDLEDVYFTTLEGHLGNQNIADAQ